MFMMQREGTSVPTVAFLALASTRRALEDMHVARAGRSMKMVCTLFGKTSQGRQVAKRKRPGQNSRPIEGRGLKNEIEDDSRCDSQKRGGWVKVAGAHQSTGTRRPIEL